MIFTEQLIEDYDRIFLLKMVVAYVDMCFEKRVDMELH